MRKQRPGIAVIGCGYWGVNYLRVLASHPQVGHLVICDDRAERLRELAGDFAGVRLAGDVAEVLAMDDVDAAIVATPARTHHRIAMACLEAGKHLLVEKPLAMSSAECDELVALAEEQSSLLMVGHTFIYNRGVRKVKEYIEHGALGHVYYLYARRTNLGPIRHDVNALWDLACHDIAIFNFLLDASPAWVSAVGARVLGNTREDVGFVSLGYGDELLGHIHVSWADPNKVREAVVVGSDMRVLFNDGYTDEPVRVFMKGVKPVPDEPGYQAYPFQMRDGDIVSPCIGLSEPLRNEIDHFLECIVDGVGPMTGGDAGRDVVMVMEAISRSVAQRGAPVEVVASEGRWIDVGRGTRRRAIR